MPRYRYRATDALGNRRTGEVDAAGPDQLAQRLEAEGLRLEEFGAEELDDMAEVVPLLEEGSSAEEPEGGEVRAGPRLSSREVADFTQHLAGLTAAGVALPPGLRALAEELPRGALRRILVDVAARLEEGRTLDQAIAEQGHRFPAHLRGLVVAGLRSGRLGEVLGGYVRYEQIKIDLQRRLWLNLAYPLLLLPALTALTVFIAVVIVKQYADIYRDFGVDLPVVTRWLIDVSRFIEPAGWGLVLIPLGAVALIWLVGSGQLGLPMRRIACRIPLIGPLWRWSTLTEFSHLLALLLESRLPLPTALPLAGEGVRDADLAASCRALAGDLEAGLSLTTAVGRRRLFPPGFLKILRWAEGRQSLPETLHMAGELFESRARSQTSVVGVLSLVVIAVSLFFGIGFLVVALYWPLYRLLNVLSG